MGWLYPPLFLSEVLRYPVLPPSVHLSLDSSFDGVVNLLTGDQSSQVASVSHSINQSINQTNKHAVLVCM